MDRKTEHEAMAEEADLESAGRTDAFAAPSARGVAPAGMFRRMAALLYDSLVMMAVLMVATTPFLPFWTAECCDRKRWGRWRMSTGPGRPR